jgi:hypothetical protein
MPEKIVVGQRLSKPFIMSRNNTLHSVGQIISQNSEFYADLVALDLRQRSLQTLRKPMNEFSLGIGVGIFLLGSYMQESVQKKLDEFNLFSSS